MYVVRRDRRPGRDGAAVDRRRDRGPAGAPVAHRLARGGRAAKGELLEALPADGTAVLNADDPIVTRMDRRTAARAVRYGFDDTPTSAPTDVTSRGSTGCAFRLRTPAGDRAVTIPTLGRLSVHNALAAAAVGLAAGLDLDAIVAALAGGWAAPHRVELVRLRGVTVDRRQLQRVAGVGRRGPRPAGRAARPSGGGPRRDARARRRARRWPPRGR